MGQVQTPIELTGPFSLDLKYLKDGYDQYDSRAQAIAMRTLAYRHKGLTVLIASTVQNPDGTYKNDEWWWRDNTTDDGLILKTTEAAGTGGGFEEADY